MVKLYVVICLLAVVCFAHCDPFDRFKDGMKQLKDLPHFGQQAGESMINSIKDKTNKIGEISSSLIDKAKDELRNVKEKAIEIEHNIEETIKNTSNSILEKLANAFKKLFQVKTLENALKFFSEVSVEISKESSEKPKTQEEPAPEKPKTSEASVSEKPKNSEEPTPEKPNSPELTPEDVNSLNQNRGAGILVDDDLRTLLIKLANPKIRTQLIKGFFSSKSAGSSSEVCMSVYEELSKIIPVFAQLMTSNSNPESIMLVLSTKVRLDQILGKLQRENGFNNCFGLEDTNLKVLLLKLTLYGGEFGENSTASPEMWSRISEAANQFELGTYQVAGSTLAQAAKEANKISVSVTDEVLNNINFMECMTIILKTKRSQPPTDNIMNDWHRAATDSTSQCLNTKNTN